MPQNVSGHEVKRMAVRVQSPRLQALLDGRLKVSELDDEELARGYPRDKNGKFSGRPPTMVPRAMQDEMMKRLLGRGSEVFKEAYIDSMKTFATIAADPNADPNVRLKAAQYVIERLTGKTPEVIHVAAEDPVETLFKSILADPGGLFEKEDVPHEPSKLDLTEEAPTPVEF